MTSRTGYLTIGLAVLVLISSFGPVLPLAEASVTLTADGSSRAKTTTTENETPDTPTATEGARSISTGTRIEEVLGENETLDRYEFTVQAGRVIRVVHHEFLDADLNLTLYGPDGETLARDTMLVKYRRTVGAAAERDGTYGIEVRGEINGSAAYAFQVDTRNPDHVEPYENVANDNRSTALEIDDRDVDLSGVLAEGEEDWYAVELDEGDRLNVTLSHQRVGEGDGMMPFDVGNGMEIDVFDAEGNDVDQFERPEKSTGDNWNEYKDAEQTAVTESTGTYYIRISSSSHVGGFAEYNVTVDISVEETSPPPTTSMASPHRLVTSQTTGFYLSRQRPGFESPS